MAPARASAHRWLGAFGWISRAIASTPATQALTKIAATTNRPAVRSARSERSRNAAPSGHGGQGVAEVVDEVGQQRDAAREDEDQRLQRGGDPEDRERGENRPQAGARALDRVVDEAVRVPMAVGVRAPVAVRVRPVVRVLVDRPATVAMPLASKRLVGARAHHRTG